MTLIGTLSLALSVLMVGVFTGLMFSLVGLLQPKWDRQSGAEYIADIQPFLKVGKGNRLVGLVLFTGLLAPIPAALARSDPLASGLIVASVVVFALGALGVTVVFNLPTYGAIMRLDASQPADEWVTLRRRFYRLNLTRFLASATAFILLVAAMAL